MNIFDMNLRKKMIQALLKNKMKGKLIYVSYFLLIWEMTGMLEEGSEGVWRRVLTLAERP